VDWNQEDICRAKENIVLAYKIMQHEKLITPKIVTYKTKYGVKTVDVDNR